MCSLMLLLLRRVVVATRNNAHLFTISHFIVLYSL